MQFTLFDAGIGLGGLTAGLLVDFDRPATFEATFLAAAACYIAFVAVLPFVAIPPRPAAPRVVRESDYRMIARDSPLQAASTCSTSCSSGSACARSIYAFPAFATEVVAACAAHLGADVRRRYRHDLIALPVAASRPGCGKAADAAA